MKASHPLIGIDISQRNIHAVQCAPSREGPIITASCSFPRLSRPDATIADEARRLTGALARRGFRGTDLVICLPDDQLITSYLELPPRSSGAPVERLAAAELGRVYKRDPANLETAVWELPAAGRKSGGAAQCLAIACEHQHTEALVDAFIGEGMMVRCVEPRMASLARAGARALTPGAAAAFDVHFVLDLGLDRSQIIALRAGKLLDRRLLEGGETNPLICELANTLHIDSSVAEILLTRPWNWDDQHGESADSSGNSKDHTKRAIASILDRFAANLNEQLRLSAEYVAHRYGGASCHGILLAGEFGDLPTIADLLAARAGLPVRAICLDDLGTPSLVPHAPIAAALGASLLAMEHCR